MEEENKNNTSENNKTKIVVDENVGVENKNKDKLKIKEKTNKDSEANGKAKFKRKISIITIIISIALIIIIITVVIQFNSHSCSKGVNNIWEQGPLVDKPVIYIYPETQTKLTVKFQEADKLTCTYPSYNGMWDVTAEVGGELIDSNTGRKLYSLYYESKGGPLTKLSEGFVIKGSETIAFLEEKLSILGLTNRESEEFIIYWLPKMQNNEYNYIRFCSLDEINNYMPIEFSTKPDTLIRILMQYKPLNEKIDVIEQKLIPASRNGFTIVEWGGTEIE